MPTFVLKKYQEETTDTNTSGDNTNTPENTNEQEEAPKELTINVIGPISEIVANALNKAFSNRIEVEIKEENSSENSENIKAISTEDINKDPLTTFNLINKDDIVFIDTNHKGFTTAKEEWFLTNIENKTKNIFYTIESLITHIENKLCLKS